MEISSENEDRTVQKAIPPKQVDSRGVTEQRKPKPPRPPITEFEFSVSSTIPKSWSTSSYFNHKNFETFSEPSVLLYRALTDTDHRGKTERKAFLRPTEHILATFYGVVFVINGKDRNLLKSEYLPIYFVRVSVKNIKYPFRILVVDNDTNRVVDFIVNCNTKTIVKEKEVCWEDQEKFGVRFSSASRAFQFHDTISRMISTLKKGEELENANSNKMIDLEVLLPNSQVKTYQFLKSTKLKDVLKFICNKERLRVNDHYLNYMQLTDDSLDIALKVGDIRTNAVRLMHKKDIRRSSTDILEKVSEHSSKKNGGIFSLFRRRFSRKSKESRMYSSAPSVLQYTDNIFMVERQTGEKKSEGVSESNFSTIPAAEDQIGGTHVTDGKVMAGSATTGRIKRKAPRPPTLVISKEKNGDETPSNIKSEVNANQVTEKKKVKRRAPSPPTLTTIAESNVPSTTKPPRLPKPPSLNSPTPDQTSTGEPAITQNGTSNDVDKKKDLPVFIAPPPPETSPPPLEECDTPVGPIDIELDEDAGTVEHGVNGVDETKLLSPNIESCDDGKSDTSSMGTEEASSTKENLENGLDVRLDSETEDENGKNKKATGDDERNNNNIEKEKNDNETEKPEIENNALKENDANTKDDAKSEKDEEIKETNETENSSSQEIKFRESIKSLSPEQLQALLNNTKNSGANLTQQDPMNAQNQQFMAMHQQQQFLSNLLMQQILQQQITQQRATSVMPMNMVPVQPAVGGVPTFQSVGGVIHPMQSVPVMQSPVGVTIPMWGGMQGQIMSPAAGQRADNLPVPTNQPQVNVNATQPSEEPTPEETKEAVKSESITEENPKESSESTSSVGVPPVKEEELVNRPLFKKMLAQISQGKLKGIPKETDTAKTATVQVDRTPPFPTNNKIGKVPTTYVESAEKNLPQAEEEEIKKHVTLGKIGRKSSYVDSAIDRHKPNDPVSTDVKSSDKISAVTSIEETKVAVSVVNQQKPEKPLQADIEILEKIPPTKTEEQKVSVTLMTDQNEVRVPPVVDSKYLKPSKVDEESVSQAGSYSTVHSRPAQNTTGQRRIEVSAPAVAEKPLYSRQISEPVRVSSSKPTIGPKPNIRPMEKRATLPKTGKNQHHQISLSLTPEERMLVPKLSGVGLTTNVAGSEQRSSTANESLKTPAAKGNESEKSRL